MTTAMIMKFKLKKWKINSENIMKILYQVTVGFQVTTDCSEK